MATTGGAGAAPGLERGVLGVDPRPRADARRLADAMSELIRVIQFRDRDRVCCYDVSPSQCYALRGIVEGEGVTVNDLSAYLFVDKSTASRIAYALAEKGYVVRESPPEDARVVRLLATDRGRALCSAIRADEERDYGALLASLSPEARAGVLDLVGGIARSFASGVEVGGGSCCVVR